MIMTILYQNDIEFFNTHGLFAGIDEAGRGALAGPVVTAAVILNYNTLIEGINDSKLLTPKKREELYWQIVESAIDYSIVEISPAYIDRYNILRATLLGFKKAFFQLKSKPRYCLIDGRDIHSELKPYAKAIIKGDQLYASIAAASILAKVHRDKLMLAYDDIYPEYGFASNKGYGTAYHAKMICSYGLSPIHRKSFKIPEVTRS
ncbi:ribonuclease HII [Candidatus Cloacimonas acidaminovorans str. Evry]|uniref:Ribonuclease HII n=2 Tax=Candidatus Cloacimonas TaxID=456826 RepID=B0VHR4_CLOAI|nr:ribonuclease HII [Candidatus Cloacimonas acidaminovorans str. Evry]